MKINTQLLLATFAIQNPSRNIACNNEAMRVIESLAPDGCIVVKSGGNMIIRKGDTSGTHPMYLAHMDQVHDYAPFMTLEIENDVLFAYDGNGEQCGTGGDDKCGVYLALEMLRRLPNVSCVFVRDEEVGCLGSGIVPMGWFDNAAFVIQSDRNNRTFDIIRKTNGMNCASDAFMEALLALPVACNHNEESGSVTDIGELASRGMPVSCVNISSGYHNPHQDTEIVRLSELAVACELALQAGLLYGNVVWEHTPTSTYSHYATSSYGGSRTGRSASYYDYLEDINDKFYAADEIGDVPLGVFESTPERERLIALLEDFGYDRTYDMLEGFDTDELEGWVESQAPAAI
jgi:tripeptide aminopeptidase